MLMPTALVWLVVLSQSLHALPWTPDEIDYNLNQNASAEAPKYYWGEWSNHTYNPSPANWRFPFYTMTLDRFADGDPTNNEANGTVFEHNWMTNQFRFGGDLAGLENDLDYFQGMGVKGLYLAGSPFINMPWSGDGYGPLDFTLLDHHHGDIAAWRSVIDEIHRRDMYVILDNTMATMGDLLGNTQYLNASTPFNWNEYDHVWKSDRRYWDFQPNDAVNASCEYPRIYGEDGFLVGPDVTDNYDGCRMSEFDMYGDIKGVGAYPSWQSQLSKFASVQDRLREWQSDVLEKIKIMSCIQIAMLDIDGFRMDKALQSTVDALGEFSSHQRECAKAHGKDNFLVVGEVVGEIPLGAVYVGRGKTPNQAYTNLTEALIANDSIQNKTAGFIRDFGDSALDGAAFHYPTYGAMTRFLGLDGPIGFESVDFVDHWNSMLKTDDMVNAITGEFDPRHMFGMTNQDVFRWPALADGIDRQLLGMVITNNLMPGIPMILWGEEQGFYVLENLAADYVFGRTPMSSSRAWQLHGCYNLGEEVYYHMPFNSSAYGCHDDSVSLDHKDPSHPMRNVIKRLWELRRQYPVLNDGYVLDTLSQRLYDIYLPGSGAIPSPTGLWSVIRAHSPLIQDFTGIGQGNQAVWFIYHNENRTMDYTFDCTNGSLSLLSAFPARTVVKNLMYPYEEYTLGSSNDTISATNTTVAQTRGCMSNLTLPAYGYKMFVPKANWTEPAPTITRVLPGHDSRLLSKVGFYDQEVVQIEIRFSSLMSCESITNSLQINSTTQTGVTAQLDTASVQCGALIDDFPAHLGEIATAWSFKANLRNVSNGVHTYTIKNATTADGSLWTNAVDKFMFRIGQSDNPIVFPSTANYSTTLLERDSVSGPLRIVSRAPGADLYRYSTNWGSSWSKWTAYTDENVTVTDQDWHGTSKQSWEGHHVMVNYWSRMTASSEHIQQGDLHRDGEPSQRWPHAWLYGSWNQYGYDSGLRNSMDLKSDGIWSFKLMAEWPSQFIVNVWGLNPDGAPDKSAAYGDIDGDGVLDWVPPQSLSDNVVNITAYPPMPYLGYEIIVNDGNFNYTLKPVGSAWRQLVLAVLLALIPIVTGAAAAYAYVRFFYQIKFNRIGISEKAGILGGAVFAKLKSASNKSTLPSIQRFWRKDVNEKGTGASEGQLSGALAVDAGSPGRRTVLVATMEYEIEDWNIKIKIGGLGVMASLMGKNLGHQNLIWVVPCAGDVEYPVDQVGEVMNVSILDINYEVEVQYHTLRNITYVLLDAPIFRKQTKSEPYPARMDDLESAIYYSAWNACIAEAIRRFQPDLYHVNDYHGTIAPLHLLPRTIPICLSLHNAEFQGLWPLRSDEEMKEICRVFNLKEEIVSEYVQFGEVFNLLHAGASYLRIHQKGFGSVGVSKKYGKRAFARYPIFWGLNNIGALPNPDPSDTAAWDNQLPQKSDIVVDETYEASRGELRLEAQRWAGLQEDPTAELFVFVGRWSQQKGIDLIADVFFQILEENPKVQLITVGPVIDLYGRFAALKLDKLMAKYPTRVCSKPVFTQLPPCIFSGAEFALIPSRDEPFGLVAVEFGRKGALGVGSRVGGLGQMPGWWFTVESTTTSHLLKQFKGAIRGALASKTSVRANMRARSSLQRFPVAQWVEDLETLQGTSIKIHKNESSRMNRKSLFQRGGSKEDRTVISSASVEDITNVVNLGSLPTSAAPSQWQSRAPSPVPEERASTSGEYDDCDDQERNVSARNSNGNESPTLEDSRNESFKSVNSLSQTSLPQMPANAVISSRTSSTNDIQSMRAATTRGRPPLSTRESRSARPSRRSSPDQGLRATFDLISFSPLQSPAASRRNSPGASSRSASRYEPRPDMIKSKSLLSLTTIVSDETKYELQAVDPFFTDSKQSYYNNFAKMLDDVNSKTSEEALCIERFLVKSERKWFDERHNAKAGFSTTTTPTTSIFRMSSRFGLDSANQSRDGSVTEMGSVDEFELGASHIKPTGLKRLFQRKIGDWQIYSFLLAFGQIIAANSYQITLITGEIGQSAEKLYIVASIYLASSVLWWFVFQRYRSVVVLSAPFAFYGMAFFLLGMAPYVSDAGSGRGWMYNVATALYAVASASGAFFFALNFGDEGGAPVASWVFRACVIQGTQQIYVAVLWYWGATLSVASASGITTNTSITSSPIITAITTPIAFLMWAIGIMLYLGLPKYYRQKPGVVPSFYRSLMRRKIVLWFFVMVILQNYWMSAPFGRNWRYFWSSSHAPTWSIILVMILFFIFVWAGLLAGLGALTKQHPWVLPIFAIGLGAPRWCQMLWGTSNIGLYVPWGGPVWGAIFGRSLWAWLGVLDAIQGVGFGMILLQTLTRVHIASTLVSAQVIGSVATMAARASAPNNIGPGSVFPDFSFGLDGLMHAWFWVALACQLVICAGFFLFFRKEQLSKP